MSSLKPPSPPPSTPPSFKPRTTYPHLPGLTRGRCVHVEARQAGVRYSIQNEAGITSVETAAENDAKLGDIVEYEAGQIRVLTTSHRAPTWNSRILDPRRLHGTRIRSQVENAIRDYFLKQDFHETRTPLLVPCPGMETHIRTYQTTTGAHLPTSPEFAMKRLLVGGLEKIFQLCPAFRHEPESTTHHPEFMMLEWYRAYAGYEEIMQDTESLFEFIALKLFGKPSLQFQGQEISVKTPWPRLQVRDLFLGHAGVNLLEASTPELLRAECVRLGLAPSDTDTWDDLYFRIWLNLIEPALPGHQAVFVTRYPPSQAALAVVDQDADGSSWARRFELYVGGLELGNAFEELTDPFEQRRRFVADMKAREMIYGADFPKTPLDEEFLQALEEAMPPSGGIAVGVDRMVMLFANEPDIEKTLWLKSFSP
ncbi:MAG: EF-P lysine aminoacylase GenX [Methylotenera sp.]|nr:EF-P lysine aminoacylase GenX [Oligoflexia bacterium]